MADVTYGACCVDDFSARALGIDDFSKIWVVLKKEALMKSFIIQVAISWCITVTAA